MGQKDGQVARERSKAGFAVLCLDHGNGAVGEGGFL